MSTLVRFGVSFTKELLEKFDGLIRTQNYHTRSKAIEDLVRQSLADNALSQESTGVFGSIDVVYDHHRRELLNKLTDIQHNFQELILSTQHIHLDHHNCFEIIIVKGEKRAVEKLAYMIKGAKGVTHCSLRLVAVPGRE